MGAEISSVKEPNPLIIPKRVFNLLTEILMIPSDKGLKINSWESIIPGNFVSWFICYMFGNIEHCLSSSCCGQKHLQTPEKGKDGHQLEVWVVLVQRESWEIGNPKIFQCVTCSKRSFRVKKLELEAMFGNFLRKGLASSFTLFLTYKLIKTIKMSPIRCSIWIHTSIQ